MNTTKKDLIKFALSPIINDTIKNKKTKKIKKIDFIIF